MGIEPTYPAWKAGVLPLNYTRIWATDFQLRNNIMNSPACQHLFYAIFGKLFRMVKIIGLFAGSDIIRPFVGIDLPISCTVSLRGSFDKLGMTGVFKLPPRAHL